MKNCYKNDPNVSNRFTITGGEWIKVGRMIFHIKELVTDKIQYYTEEDLGLNESYSEPLHEE